MPEPDQSPEPQVPRPWQPRYSLSLLFWVMTVFCFMAAGGHYLVRSFSEGKSLQLVFIISTLAAPVLVMVGVSLFMAFLKYQNRNRRG